MDGVDLSVFGAAGVTIAILLYFIKLLWDDNKVLRQENKLMAELALEKMTEVSSEASHQIQEGARSVEAATVMMHQLAGRPTLSPEQLTEVAYHLRALREIRERGM